MLNHIGTREIKTNRMILRRVKIEDTDKIFENWCGDPEVVKYLTWKEHKTKEQTKNIISRWCEFYKKPYYYCWAIAPKDDPEEVIGDIDVVRIFPNNECCDIGYTLAKRYWNKGIMTECLHEVLNYLFSKVGFHRIEAYHDVRNKASGRVMEKNGMKYEGVLREYSRNGDGYWVDVAMYSILKEEFKYYGS